MKAILAFVSVLGVVGGSIFGYRFWQDQNHSHTSFRAAAVARGNVWATISATGTVRPEEIIDVGAQVAGRIESFGRDPRDSSRTIDFNSVVHKNTVLAQLDDTLFKSRVAQMRASLRRAEAEVDLAQARLVQTEREWERARRLGPQRAVSGLDIDTAQANFETTRAAEAVARANAELARAALAEAEINLGYTTI